MTETKAQTQAERQAEDWYLGILADSSSGLKSTVVRMSPEMSRLLLENNPENRRVRTTKVQQYISDMKAGLWKLNGEPIILTKDGLVNDGQHRLEAISQSGIAIQTLLVYGAERSTRDTIDVGVGRTPGDMLSFHGHVNASTLAAITRQVLGFEDNGTLHGLNRISTAAVVERAGKDEMLRLVASWVQGAGVPFQRLVTLTVAGTAFYLIQSAAPLQAKKFMESFRDGDNLSKESPIFVLRRRLAIGERLTNGQKLEAIIRAWNAWIRDEKVAKIQLMGNVPAVLGPKKAVK